MAGLTRKDENGKKQTGQSQKDKGRCSFSEHATSTSMCACFGPSLALYSSEKPHRPLSFWLFPDRFFAQTKTPAGAGVSAELTNF